VLRDKRTLLRFFAVLTVVMLVGAACGGGDDGDDGGGGIQNEDIQLSEDVEPGGELRIASSSDVDYMDPASMYYTVSFFLARGVFRNLVHYPGNVTDMEAQNELVPDLATGLGEPNEDFTEWTYTIQDGVLYGKALGGEDVSGVTGEEIVCDDFKYALERVFLESVGGGYPFYYDMIEGAEEFPDNADEISGIECVDEKTITFHLAEPVGDWDFRMAMAAASPVPRAAAEQYDKKEDSDYDSHVVATGPYYIAEWTPGEQIQLERNEHWDPETDQIREAYVDSVDWQQGYDNDVGVQKILDGEEDLAIDVSPQGPVLEEVVTDPELSSRFINEPEGCTRYLYMNTRLEPFDDPLVRQAVNYAIDRSNIKRVFGGPTTGPIATSVVPPGLAGYLPPEEFNPYETPDMAGDMARAKELMAEAGYPDGYDKTIKVVGASDPPHDKIFETVRADLEELGFSNIDGKTPKFPNQYTQFYSVPDQDVHFGTSAGWCKDYNSAYTFLEPLFHSKNILPSGNQNYAELDDPQMDELIDTATATAPGEEQTAAWEEANRYATETAVWVPWSWDASTLIYSDRVVNAYYLSNHSGFDWVNVGIDQGAAE
ncbi:MAG: ABC transporter substrate-binding protein, partial [Actinomycetota bacterium]